MTVINATADRKLVHLTANSNAPAKREQRGPLGERLFDDYANASRRKEHARDKDAKSNSAAEREVGGGN